MTAPAWKPYFEQHGIAIYHGDSADVLPSLSLAADMVLADPNYGETSLAWDRREFGWIAALPSCTKPNASLWCFGSLRMFMAAAATFADAGWRLAQDIVWEKHNGSSGAADRFKRVHECAAHFYRDGTAWSDVYSHPVHTNDATKRQVRRKKGPSHWGEIGEGYYMSKDGGLRLMRSVQYVRSCHGYADHPTQKPIGIVRPLLLHSCPVGGLVIDPTLGSGTTLVVAKECGMRAVGVDRDEANCEIAAKRLASTLALGLA